MSSIFTEEELATFAPFEKTEKTVVDNINVTNNECPDGFEKNSKGECVKKVKKNGVAETDASVTPEKNTASSLEVGSSDYIPTRIGDEINDISLDEIKQNTDTLEEYTYEQLLLDEKTEKEIDLFNKTYKPKVKNIEDVNSEIDIEGDVEEKSNKMFSYLIKNNETIKEELLPQAVSNIKDSLFEEKYKIDSKYDLTNPDQLIKAQEEFTTIFNEKIEEELNKSNEYKNIIKTYQNYVSKEAGIQTRKLTRTSLGLGDEETQGLFTSVLEGIGDFVTTDIPRVWNNLQNMIEGGDYNQSSTRVDILKEKLNLQDINLSDKFDKNFINNNYETTTQVEYKALKEIGEEGTIEDALNYMETRELEMKENVIVNFEDLEKIEWRAQWAKEAKIFDEDGLTMSDVATMAGKQILQLPLAYFTFGMSAALQETGGNYGQNLKALAIKEYGLKEGEEPTQEQMLRLMEEGKDDKIVSVISGIASGALEYIGAKKAVTAALFGKEMVGSFVRGQFKQAGISALQTGAAALEAGFYESITETGQAISSQIGESIIGEKNAFNFEEILESAGQGYVIGTLFPLAGGAARQSMTEYRATAAKISAKYGNDAYGEALYKEMESGVNKRFEEENSEKWQKDNPDQKPMTEQERRNKIINIGQVRTANNKLPKSMDNVEDKQKSIELLVEKKELVDKNKDVAPELISQEDKNRIKQINLDLTILSGKAGLRKITIEDQKQMVEMVNALDNINAKAYESTAEAQAAWDAVVDENASKGLISALEGLNEKDRAKEIQKIKDGFSGVNANILYLKGGGEAIVLNNDVINQGGAIDAVAANHEVLHSVLRRAIGTDQKAFEQIYNVLDPFLQQNLDENTYAALSLRFAKNKNAGEFDEYLTAIGELMRGGSIKYDKSFIEVAQSLGTMIANFFRKLFGKKIPPAFDLKNKETGEYDAKKVFNFLKSYQRAYNTGGNQAQIFADEINAMSVDQTGEGPNVRSSQSTLYENVNEIYNQYEDKSTAGLLAADLYENEINSRLNKGFRIGKVFTRPTEWDGWTEEIQQDTVSDMKYSNRGIKGLVEKYNETDNKGVTLPAYINTFFNVRLLEAMPDNLVASNMSIENLNDSQQLTSDPEFEIIESDSKARVLKSFSDFNTVSDTVFNDIKDLLVSTVSNLFSEQEVTPERILEVIESLVSSDIRNMIKASTEGINQVDGKTVISPEYGKFITEIYDGAMQSLSVDVIKRKYSRAKNAPFVVKQRPGKKGKEKVKKVNPETGKVTYFNKGIFDIKSRGRGAWGSFFTSLAIKYTTLRERQNSITSEIAAALTQKVLNDLSNSPETLKQLTPDQNVNAAVGVKNTLDNIAEQIDRKLGEQKSFDSFRSSASTVRNLPIEAQAAVAAALRSDKAVQYVADSNGSMLNVVERLFAGTNVLNQTRINKVAEELQEIYDSVIGKPEGAVQLEGYDLNDFLASQLESKSEVNTYKDLFLAFGFDANFNYDSKTDIEKARQTLNIIAKKVGREFFILYLAPGFTSPSKISKGQFVPDGLGVKRNENYVVGKGIKKPDGNFRSNDQRYGVIESAIDLENNILLGVESKPMPEGLDYFALTGRKSLPTNLSKPPKKGTMYSDKQIAEIVEAGKFTKKAYDYLIKELRILGPAGNGTITPGVMLFLFKGMNASTKAITRTAAELGYIPDGEFNETMVLEHIIQAVTMSIIALDHVLAPIATDAFDLTLKDYKTTYLPESYDTIINKFYKQVMPNYWRPGMTGMVRYYNLETYGEFTLNLIDLKTGKVFGEEFANTIDYKKAKPYIKGKPTVVERFNKVVTANLGPEATKAAKEADKIRLNNAVKFIAELDKVLNFNKEILDSSGVFRSSTSSNQRITIDETINEAKKLDALVQKDREDYFEENYPYRSSESTASMSDQFNIIIEETKGVGAEKIYSRARAMAQGKNRGKWAFIMDPSAEDFKGLIYSFIGEGKNGEKQLKFFNDTLFRPFAQAMSSIDTARQALSNDYRGLLKQYPNVKKIINKDSGYGDFTIDSAIRVYLFNKSGFSIPGLSKRDLEALNAVVENDPSLIAFAEDLSRITKQQKAYIEPGEFWLTESIPADLEAITKRIGRKKYLETWVKNKNEIFSKDNLNKIEALYGTDFREALEDILTRMETGSNRLEGGPKNRIANSFMNWVNNSVGAIMFFNARSAVLQTISAFNFINFTDNNIYKAGVAFSNTEQYWADFTFLFNSDFLKQRRSGLQGDINAAELASAIAGKRNKAKAALNYLLTKGFLPTQIADSFAIASGGATFYRNRINTLMKQGMTKSEAEAEAMIQWRELSEEAQQSSRPDKISQQQAGPLGRVILAFANTPMQYTRLQKRAIQDLINGRGDWKENMGKILYYGFVQNLIFNALQSALFALLFDDDEELDPKGGRIANGMADSLLRGLGIYGAAVSAAKNMILEAVRQSEKSRPDYQNAALQALSISPPISSKINKLRSAAKTWQYNRDDIRSKGLSLDNPAYLASTKIISALTNIPADRLFMKLDNLRTATEEDTEMWQSIALVLGWDQWSLGLNPYSSGKSSKRKTRSRRKRRTRK